MNIKKLGITISMIIMILFLIFVNIGLNISGPARYEEYKNQVVLEKVQKRFPLISSLYRHNFKYVTYGAISQGNAYVFDYEGILIMEKPFDESMITEIQELVYTNYGIQDAKVNIGFGYDNMVFVVEEEDRMIYYDYDTKEVVYYLKGNLV